MGASTTSIIACKGLMTNPNPLAVPDGGMRELNNVVLPRDDLIQSRRGHTRGTSVGSEHNKLIPYQDILLAHYGTTGGISPYTGGAHGSAYAGTYVPPSGHRVNHAQMLGNLYITTDSGPFRLSGSANAFARAGVPKAIGADRSLSSPLAAGDVPRLDGASGFLADGQQVAYRCVIGVKDDRANIHLGSPSGRLIVSNSSSYYGYTAAQSRNVVSRWLIPAECTTKHFIQVYRSRIVGSGIEPSDDMQLCYEAYFTDGDLTAGYVEITDIATDALLGAYGYFSPNAGDGLLAAKEPMPRSVDLCVFKDALFQFGTHQRDRLIFTILSVGGTDGIQDGDTLDIAGVTYTAAATPTGAAGEYKLETAGTASQNIEQTAANLVAAVNKHAGNSSVYAFYISGRNELPGRILIESRLPDGSQAFTIAAGPGSKRLCFNPIIPPSAHTVDLARVGSTVTATVTAGAQSFRVGEQVNITPGNADFPAGAKTITAIGAATFEYTEAGTATSLAGQSAAIYADNNGSSTAEDKPNRAYFSPYLEPESAPLTNFVDVGTEEAEILRALPLREQIFVFKEDGVYRIVGSDEASFRCEAWDTTLRFFAAETIVALSNSIYALSNKGVVRVDEGGVAIVSGDIESDLLDSIATKGESTYAARAFAVAYEEDNHYILWLPTGRSGNGGSLLVTCSDAFVYNTARRGWSSWSRPATADGVTCGVVNPADGKLYLADGYNGVGGDSYIYPERKTRTAADLVDQKGDGTSVGIDKTVAWIIQTANAPWAVKHFSEIVLHFRETAVTVTITYENEYGSATGGTTATGNGSKQARDWVRREAQRGTRLIVRVTHDTASEALDIAGLTVRHAVLGMRANR